MSLTFAAVTGATSGTPRASLTMWCLDPPCGDRLGSVQFFSPAHRADRPAVHYRPALVEPSLSAQLGEEGLMQATPDAGPFPLHQASSAQLPEPHPISRGNICHGNAPRSTNRMPVSAARSETRGRPLRRRARRRGFGSNGSRRAHSASSKRGCAMRDRTKSTAQVQEISQRF